MGIFACLQLQRSAESLGQLDGKALIGSRCPETLGKWPHRSTGLDGTILDMGGVRRRHTGANLGTWGDGDELRLGHE